MPRRRLRLSILSLALLLGSGGCVFSCEADTLPDPLTCNNAPVEAQVESLSLATGPDDPAQPLADGAPTYVVVDLEGRLLVSIRAMWRGDDAPACAKAELRIRHPDTGVELDSESVSLLSSPAGDARVSGEIFFVVDAWPAVVEVELDVYGTTLTQRVQVGGYPLDGGIAELPDAGLDAAVDAAPDAAQRPDAG